MRTELERLLVRALEGDDDSSIVLKCVLDNCRRLVALSRDEWAGQPAECTWPDLCVQPIAPELAYFLPTPAELEEAMRRLRLKLVEGGRLNVRVLRVLHNLADRSVFFPLVDVLEGYDGDPARYDEVEDAMNILPLATGDAPEAGSSRARRALLHVREVGADVVERGYSLRYWANDALAAFGDDDAERQMDEEERPLPEGWAEQQAKARALFDELYAAKTAEVLVTVDEVDEDCAGHLYVWSSFGDGSGTMGSPLHALCGSVAEAQEDFNPYARLRSGMWVARLAPASLLRLFEDISLARWQKPELVQVLVKNGEPYFVLYMLRDGELRRCAPADSGTERP
jgi:hypothetical protein